MDSSKFLVVDMWAGGQHRSSMEEGAGPYLLPAEAQVLHCVQQTVADMSYGGYPVGFYCWWAQAGETEAWKSKGQE